jgi:hypothetical protein
MNQKTREPPHSVPEPVPFSHLLDVNRVPEEGLDVAISADPDERRALAAFDQIPAIERLDADFHVARRSLTRFNVSGEVRARVTQTCVVTLEPFEAEIVEPSDVDFAPAEEIGTAADAAAPSPDAVEAEEPPDAIVDGKIDLGALAAEFLALGLDPYPRKPGASFESTELGLDSGSPGSPFDILKKMQDPKKQN